MVTIPEQSSIFGNTYQGVPNPLVPHRHPYPTRYHGPIWVQPEAIFSYRPRPYWIAHDPNVVRRMPGPSPNIRMYDMSGTEPDGLGDAPPLLASPTGHRLIDVLIGGGLGWILGPKKDTKPLWAAGGAVAALLTGTLGIIGTAAAGAYVHYKD
jgi:hypothetical protein